MIKKVVLVLWFCVFLSGCSPSALNFKIQYQRVNGLKPEQRVVYDNKPIGSITGIELSKDGTYLVAVLIEPEHVDKITVDSEFFISTDPNQPDEQAIEVVSASTKSSDGSETESAAMLKEGTVVKGMEVATQTDVLVDELKKGLTDGLGGLMQQMEIFTDQLEQLPESKEFKQFEKELRHFGKEMGEAGEKIQKKMDEEYIPRLQESLDKLEKELGKPPAKQTNPSDGVDV